MAKFTFKTEKSSGKYAAFYPDYYIIKFNKVEVGNFSVNDNGDTFKIHLRVYKTEEDKQKPKNNPNCDWKIITFTKTFPTLDEAKLWLNTNKEQILAKYNLVKE